MDAFCQLLLRTMLSTKSLPGKSWESSMGWSWKLKVRASTIMQIHSSDAWSEGEGEKSAQRELGRPKEKGKRVISLAES